MMREISDFDKLKKSIKNLNYKDQLKRLIRARTEYQQNRNANEITFGEKQFDEKCNLEIKMIKELMDLGVY